MRRCLSDPTVCNHQRIEESMNESTHSLAATCILGGLSFYQVQLLFPILQAVQQLQ